MSWYFRPDFCSLTCQSNSECTANILVRSELHVLESSHELGRKTESPQAQTALRAAAGVVDKRDCPLVHLFLVEKLVLNDVHVDKVAHVGASIPANVMGVNVHLPEHADHLFLVDGVRLCAGSSGGGVGSGIVKVRLWRDFDDGEGERVCDFENTADVHTNDRAGRSRWESLGAVLDDFHHNLAA